MKARTLLSWSSGKDSAWALHLLRQQSDIEVVGLVTTFNETANRVAMHAVRRELVHAQANAAGLPLWSVELPWPCCNEEYERRMAQLLSDAREQEISHFAFGDLFLEDIRAYRCRQLAGSGIEPLFPLWGVPDATADLAQRMIAAGVLRGHYLRRSQAIEGRLRWPRVRRRIARRLARWRRSLRRKGRVPHILLCRSDVLATDFHSGRRADRTRRLLVRGRCPWVKSAPRTLLFGTV